MAASATTTVEIDAALLRRLHKRHPRQSNRELLESVARIQLGLQASDRVRSRFADTSSAQIEAEAVKAAHQVRRERAASRLPKA
jgi:hypothetical protein